MTHHIYIYLIYYPLPLTLQAKGYLTAEDIEETIKPYIRNPLPRKSPDDIPNDVSDISTYLKFVNREKEIIKLIRIWIISMAL